MGKPWENEDLTQRIVIQCRFHMISWDLVGRNDPNWQFRAWKEHLLSGIFQRPTHGSMACRSQLPTKIGTTNSLPLLGGSSHLVSGLVQPSYKWTLPPLIPFITNVITHLLSGMNHQVGLLNSHDQNYQNCWFPWNLRTHALKLTTWMQFSLPLSILTPSSLRGAKVWALESWVATRWCPPSYKLVYNPNNYRYNPHKP